MPHDWDETDALQARREGWDLFDADHTGRLEIQAYDESCIFDSDTAALGHVYAMAGKGSKLHRRALAACQSDKLEQQALVAEEKSYKPIRVRSDGLKVETRVERLPLVDERGRRLPDSEIAAYHNHLMTKMADQNFKVAQSWSNYDEKCLVMVFERTERLTGGFYFNRNHLVAELRKLLYDPKEWSVLQKIHIQYMPDGWSDHLPAIANELAKGGPSGHIIPVQEMALMLVRVFMLGQGGPMQGLYDSINSIRDTVGWLREHRQHVQDVKEGYLDCVDRLEAVASKLEKMTL